MKILIPIIIIAGIVLGIVAVRRREAE